MASVVPELTVNTVMTNTGELEMFLVNFKKIVKSKHAQLGIMNNWIFTKTETSKENTEKVKIETKTTKEKKE